MIERKTTAFDTGKLRRVTSFLAGLVLSVSLSPAGSLAQGLQAEPQVATGKFTSALEVKPILNATRGNWIGVREWEGQDLIYVTHLWAWRCGLLQMEVSVNGAGYEIWPMPPCHMDIATPNAIRENDGLPYRAYRLKSVIEVSVRVTYDDLTMQEAGFPRGAILLP